MNFFGTRTPRTGMSSSARNKTPKQKRAEQQEMNDGRSAVEVFGFARRAAVEINKGTYKSSSVSDATERTVPTFSVSESLSEEHNGISYISSSEDSGDTVETSEAKLGQQSSEDETYEGEEQIELSNQGEVMNDARGMEPSPLGPTSSTVEKGHSKRGSTKNPTATPPPPPNENKTNRSSKKQDKQQQKVYRSFISNHPTAIGQVTSAPFDNVPAGNNNRPTAIGTASSGPLKRSQSTKAPRLASVDLRHTNTSVEMRMQRSHVNNNFVEENHSADNESLTQSSSSASSPLHSVYSNATTDYTDITESASREQSLLDDADTMSPANGSVTSLVSEFFGGSEVASPANSVRTYATADDGDDLIDELRRGFMDAMGCNFYFPQHNYDVEDDAESFTEIDPSPSDDVISRIFTWSS